MAIHVRKSIVIDKPVQDVWHWILDNETVWRAPVVKEVRKIREGQGGHGEVGARYEARTQYGIISSRSVQEITAYNPPHRVTWDTIEGGGLIPQKDSSYIVEEAGDGRARVVLDFTYDARGIASLLEPLLRPGMSSAIDMLLENIKKGLGPEPREEGG